jgi:ABC-type multidrug transport system fused ATPase/permease subunit
LATYFSYNMFLAFMIAPVFQMVNIGTQLTEAFAGLDRTSEIMAELEENKAPGRTAKMPPIQGTVRFEDVEFAYDAGKACSARHQLCGRGGNGDGAGGLLGFGKVHHHQLIVRLSHPDKRRACWWTAWILRRLT